VFVLVVFVWYTDRQERSKFHQVLDELQGKYAEEIQKLVESQNASFLQTATKRIDTQIADMKIPDLQA
jgi:hypothetical protein